MCPCLLSQRESGGGCTFPRSTCPGAVRRGVWRFLGRMRGDLTRAREPAGAPLAAARRVHGREEGLELSGVEPVRRCARWSRGRGRRARPRPWPRPSRGERRRQEGEADPPPTRAESRARACPARSRGGARGDHAVGFRQVQAGRLFPDDLLAGRGRVDSRPGREGRSARPPRTNRNFDQWHREWWSEKLGSSVGNSGVECGNQALEIAMGIGLLLSEEARRGTRVSLRLR